MPSFRRLLLSLALLGVTTVASAQNPGDPVEYRVQRSPEKWQVGTFVGVLPNGTHVVVRLALSAFAPVGVERVFPLEDVRPVRNTAFRGTTLPPPQAGFLTPAPASPAPAPASPPVVVAAAPALPACGPRPNPERDRLECVQQVQRISTHWAACQAGNGVACHRFVRDVARALSAGDPRWGLVTKPRGQQACTEHACGRDLSGGYGEDMVAYLPPGHGPHQWLGSDIIGGAGAPGARIQWGNPQGYATNRSDNHWSVVPR